VGKAGQSGLMCWRGGRGGRGVCAGGGKDYEGDAHPEVGPFALSVRGSGADEMNAFFIGCGDMDVLGKMMDSE
jgi:hypothetical protein